MERECQVSGRPVKKRKILLEIKLAEAIDGTY